MTHMNSHIGNLPTGCTQADIDGPDYDEEELRQIEQDKFDWEFDHFDKDSDNGKVCNQL